MNGGWDPLFVCLTLVSTVVVPVVVRVCGVLLFVLARSPGLFDLGVAALGVFLVPPRPPELLNSVTAPLVLSRSPG